MSYSPVDGRPAASHGRSSSGKSKAEEKPSCWQKTKKFFGTAMEVRDKALDRFGDWFAILAMAIWKYPWLTIIGSVLLCVIFCIGLLPGFFGRVEGAEALYSLPSSEARDAQAIFLERFPESNMRANTLILTSSAGDGRNILTYDFLEKVTGIDRLVRGKARNPKTNKNLFFDDAETGERVEYEDVCPRLPTGVCDVQGVLAMTANLGAVEGVNCTASSPGAATDPFCDVPPHLHVQQTQIDALDQIVTEAEARMSILPDYDRETFIEAGELEQRLGLDQNRPEIYVFGGLVFNPWTSRAFVPEYLLGGIKKERCYRLFRLSDIESVADTSQADEIVFTAPFGNGIPVNLTAEAGLGMMDVECITETSAYLMLYNTKNATVEEVERSKGWENALLTVFEDFDPPEGMEIFYTAFRSRDDELSQFAASDTDLMLTMLTFVLLISYSAAVSFSCDLYKSKAIPALAGCTAAVLGCLAGIGLASLFGVKFVPTALVTIFLVLGIGVDDAFVILNAYNLAYLVELARDRVALAMKDSGVGITMTTSTNILAFLIGSSAPYLAIRNFCYFSALGMLMGYIMSNTFFVAFLVLDAKREEAGRLLCFCLPAQSDVEARVEARENKKMQATMQMQATGSHGRNGGATGSHGRNMAATGRNVSNMTMRQTFQGTLAEAQAKNPNNFSLVAFKARIAMKYDEEAQAAGPKRMVTRPEHLKMGNVGSPSGKSHISISYNHRDGTGRPRDRERDRQRRRANDPEAGPTPAVRGGGQGGGMNGTMNATGRTNLHSTQHKILQQVPELLHDEIFEEPKGLVGRGWRMFFLHYYGPFILHKWVKIFLLLGFAGLFAAACVGFSQLGAGLDLTVLAADDSYIVAYDLATRKYFGSFDYPVEIFFEDRHEWYDLEVQAKLSELENNLLASEDIEVILSPFQRMLQDDEYGPDLRSGDPSKFYPTIHKLVTDPDSNYFNFGRDFIFDSNEKLVTFKFNILPRFMINTEVRAQMMTEVREICANARPGITPVSFGYLFIFLESDLQILPEVIQSMSLAVVVMFLIACLSISDTVSIFFVLALMGVIDVELFGFMYFWDLKLNMLTMICLIIAAGFAVDYLAHVCHTFSHCEGETRDLRVIETLVLMGVPVFNGGITTMLGVFLLAFTNSFIFRVFFKMMTMVCGFGLLNALCLLPILLSYFGQLSTHGHRGEEDAKTAGGDDNKSLGLSDGRQSRESDRDRHRDRRASKDPIKSPTMETQHTDPDRYPDEGSEMPFSDQFVYDSSGRPIPLNHVTSPNAHAPAREVLSEGERSDRRGDRRGDSRKVGGNSRRNSRGPTPAVRGQTLQAPPQGAEDSLNLTSSQNYRGQNPPRENREMSGTLMDGTRRRDSGRMESDGEFSRREGRGRSSSRQPGGEREPRDSSTRRGHRDSSTIRRGRRDPSVRRAPAPAPAEHDDGFGGGMRFRSNSPNARGRESGGDEGFRGGERGGGRDGSVRRGESRRNSHRRGSSGRYNDRERGASSNRMGGR
uniref:SSD domain-containing protein n=1 Tax=Chromera velia CCMP2878 TaxID=1169474 RepID=A0A0G4F0Z5_9ALVE|eukprot:Cvel_14507.t1-p1 / transcript=Cvel_14507.t1 / gene=Cvel_14507 / organism=Chromera_velia_CCMP2878 / gene_product=Patched domain-containing protein 3, putative / transcript_product=Patched domain-containing protein 3, putative / location=Cvel_scaffold1035:13429-23465(+) / protein_length=1508 / sequence_SO=supercontig / SO=protein_coding / is_pseudo=false